MIHLSQATEVLARRLAEAQHLTVDDAVRHALERRAREAGIALDPTPLRDTSAEAIARRLARFDEFSEKIAAMPILDRRSPKEIMDDLNEL